MIKTVTRMPDGRTREDTYQNGEILISIYFDSDGRKYGESIYANGKLLRFTETTPDGRFHEQIYHEDGWLQSERREESNGSWSQNMYQGDGILLKVEFTNDSLPDKPAERTVYNSDGSLQYTESYSVYTDLYNGVSGQYRSHIFELGTGERIHYVTTPGGTRFKRVESRNMGPELYIINNYTGPETPEI